MIKEYFTDGLIGLAVLLSLFRTDLVGINNLINYPEVQDIFLGQTAAYLPANFHHIHSSQHAIGNPKYIDFDNHAFTAWYQNVNNLPLFQERRRYEIEAFLVSSSQHNAGEHFLTDYTTNAVVESNSIPEVLSSALPEESATSFVEEILQSLDLERPSTSAAADGVAFDVDQPVIDMPVLFTSPFPGCNLTEEDLKLIDILYQQDVDLGVGKEVFDRSMREELERERELESIKQNELLLAEEKKEREEQERKNKWLEQNFRRDGETGEWIQLPNETIGNISSLTFPQFLDPSEKDANFTLDDALDFLGNLERAHNGIDTDTYPEYTPQPIHELQMQQFEVSAQQHEEPEKPVLKHQDSFEENWNGLVDYLNMTRNNVSECMSNSSNTFLQLSNEINISVGIPDLVLEQDVDLQADYLIQNATMPSIGVDISTDFSALTAIDELNSAVPLQSTNDSIVDFDIGDLGFFNNLTAAQNESTDGFGLDEVSDLFVNIQETDSKLLVNKAFSLADNMDAIQMLEDNLSTPVVSNGSGSPYHDFCEPFDALEGAIGGSDYGDVSDHFLKVSRLSESSNDSGFVNQGAFSSPSSSAPSSYAGSPAGSHNGMNSSSSNDTEHDPHGTRAVANQHVAHNHTYNTPPGQVPREVKKYAQKEPSRKGPHSRDQRRAEELKIPFTIDDIIDSPVETFNEMLTKHKLSEAQLILVRDIRRRGKNKVAAQNCRKRKVGVIFSLSDEMADLQKMRDRLVAERAAMDRERRKMKEKFGHLYTHIFQSLRDERGEPYDPSLYSLQQSSDGNVFLVPRNFTVSRNSSSPSSSSSSSEDSAGSKKRKSFEN